MTGASEVPERAVAWRMALLVAAAYLLGTGWGLWAQSIENPDEPRYACAAREMALGRGDWMVPRFNGEPRLVKPVLIYWLMAASAKLTAPLGVGMVTAFRLPSLLFGLLAVLSVFGLGRRLWNGRVGVLAGLLLTTTFYFHTTAREIVIDPLVAGSLAWSWYGFVVVLQKLKDDPEKTPYLALLGFYAGLGVACMAKGPAPVGVFAAVPMGVFLVWNRKAIVPEGKGLGWLALRSGVLWGAPLALGLGFAWFAMLYGTEYRDQMMDFFVEQNFARGVGALDHNDGLKRFPFVYYLLDCPQKFMPWTLLAVPAVYLWTRPRAQAATPETSLGSARFFVCAILIPFVCIGLAGSKRSLYALPLYPMLALGGAVVLGRVLSERRAALAVKALLVLALAAAGFEAFGRPILEKRKRADL
ncbi:MAG: glycosyltransferase family 39 protein, partial [Planctomycetota bacterium]|nr:glycosyltransferase family 39 protein [Planctomycetota bacterium]